MENNNKPVVHLISKPDNMLKTIYTAARTCYSADTPFNIYESTDDEEKMLKLIERVIGSGHYSVIEHIQVTFAISNVSRACTHQFVRHRHMSFSQKSQRYVKEKGQFDYIIPPTIARDEALKTKFIEFMGEISQKYLEFTEAGIPAEDARAVLPNAAASSIVASLNLREMIHLANLRLCTRAQYEIRTMIKMMCEELLKEEPCSRLTLCRNVKDSATVMKTNLAEGSLNSAYEKAAITLSVLFLGLVAIYFFLLKPEKYVEADLYDEILERGTLKVGINTDSKPFGFFDENWEVKGYDADLARYIAQYILKSPNAVEFYPVTPANRMLKVSTGDVDMVIATMTITPQRREIIDFSVPYDLAGQALLVRSNSRITSIADLAGQNVGVVFGTTAEKNMLSLAPAANIIGFRNYRTAYTALKGRKN